MSAINQLLVKLDKLPTSGCQIAAVSGYTDAKGAVSNYRINVGVSYPNAVKRDTDLLTHHVISDDDILEFGAHVGKLKEIPEATQLLNDVASELEGLLEPGKEIEVKGHPSYAKFRELLMEGASVQQTASVWLLQEAQAELLAALTKPTEATKNRSEAQKDAYRALAPGLKFHRENGDIYIVGSKISKISKNAVVNVAKKADTRKPLTQAKDFLRKKYLRTANWRQFKLSDVSTVTMDGDTIVITNKKP